MKAAIFDKPYRMQIGIQPTPRAKLGEVVVANKVVGICAGDMYIYQGKNPYAPTL